jgi:hypothetical protein
MPPSCAHRHHPGDAFLDQLTQRMGVMMASFKPQDHAMALTALAKLGFRPTAPFADTLVQGLATALEGFQARSRSRESVLLREDVDESGT